MAKHQDSFDNDFPTEELELLNQPAVKVVHGAQPGEAVILDDGWRSAKVKPRLHEIVRVLERDGNERLAFFDRTGIWFDKDTKKPISDPPYWRRS